MAEQSYERYERRSPLPSLSPPSRAPAALLTLLLVIASGYATARDFVSETDKKRIYWVTGALLLTR